MGCNGVQLSHVCSRWYEWWVMLHCGGVGGGWGQGSCLLRREC